MGGVTRTLTLNATFHHFAAALSVYGSHAVWASKISLYSRRFFVTPLISLGNFKSFFFFEQRPNAETFSFIDVKLFNSSSWVETLSKLTSFLSSPCHLLCNLFLGNFPDAPAGLQLCRVTISFPFLHADVIVSRKCGFLQN